MSSTLKNCASSRKSLSCIPVRILALRKRRGWNQRQLADASGLSQRVISKAEAGKTLQTQSVQQIASALATDSDPVFPEDLITDQLAIAEAYLNAFHTRQARMTEGIYEHFTQNPTFDFSGSEKKILFAGSHQGVNEFDQAIRYFFRMFRISSNTIESKYDFYENDNQVVCWGKMKIGLIESLNLKTTTFAIRFYFERGKIKHIESHFDFQLVLDQAESADFQTV